VEVEDDEIGTLERKISIFYAKQEIVIRF